MRKVLQLRKGEYAIVEEEREKINIDEKGKKRLLRAINLATELGFVVAFPIVAGALLGTFIDEKLNTAPKGTLSFILIGAGISIFQIITITKRNLED